MRSLVTNIVLLVLLVLVSAPLLLLYLFIFFFIGIGWAYAGPNGCHPKLNVIGWTMILFPAVALSALALKRLVQPSQSKPS
ncbi:MAG TPA: hypothetical protein VJS64_13025 [Pyrinomonadaceae bacterium]|nr:hypothetical protein [Pyrinomonadaceae bacterium]